MIKNGKRDKANSRTISNLLTWRIRYVSVHAYFPFYQYTKGHFWIDECWLFFFRSFMYSPFQFSRKEKTSLTHNLIVLFYSCGRDYYILSSLYLRNRTKLWSTVSDYIVQMEYNLINSKIITKKYVSFIFNPSVLINFLYVLFIFLKFSILLEEKYLPQVQIIYIIWLLCFTVVIPIKHNHLKSFLSWCKTFQFLWLCVFLNK